LSGGDEERGAGSDGVGFNEGPLGGEGVHEGGFGEHYLGEDFVGGGVGHGVGVLEVGRVFLVQFSEVAEAEELDEEEIEAEDCAQNDPGVEGWRCSDSLELVQDFGGVYFE